MQTTVVELPGPRFVLAFGSPRLPSPLPALAVLGALPRGPGSWSADAFVVHEPAIDHVHRVLAEVGGRCPGIVREAKRTADGYVYVVDQRTPSDQTVEARDVLGAFEVRGGTTGRYIASADYEVVTERGPMELDPWLYDAVIDALCA